MQLRNLNFLEQEQDGSHSDHSPQCAQTPATNKQIKITHLNVQVLQACS